MKISITTKITFLFGLLIVITFCHFILLINIEKKMNELLGWVLHTHEVIEESERLLGHLRDAETRQRGFLLTLNNSYLEPFNSDITQSDSKFALLEKLTEDNTAQQKLLGSIQGLMRKKISELEKTVQLAKQDKMSEAMEIVNSNNGKIVMDTIRDRLRDFISVEENLLKQRNALYFEHRNKLVLFSYVEAILLIVLIFIFYLLIQKSIVRPLIVMSEYISNEGNELDGPGIKIKPRNDEIGILAESFNKLHRNLREQTNKKNDLISELQIALREIKSLKGIIPICSHCHKIRDDEGAWNRLESYIGKHSEAEFSHGICPECAKKHYPDFDLFEENAK